MCASTQTTRRHKPCDNRRNVTKPHGSDNNATFTLALPRVVHDPAEFAKTAAMHPSATLRIAAPVHPQSSSNMQASGPMSGPLELAEQIGEGGMGIVRAAMQRSLNRRVAVKSLLPDSAPGDAVYLYREAWITGLLEHPNIVPVYDLARDARGGPLLVMKLIEGAPWSSLLGSSGTLKLRFNVTDSFTWHLRVLIQVCQAIAMAHAKHIVHRDLKPENILIGQYGQVYVADWGIAASLVEDPSGRIPSVRELPLAGTPAYMAPEMWAGDPEKIGPATDIYLLGGVLHEILTGKPPNTPENFKDPKNMTVPLLGHSNMPEELQGIARRALDPIPERRFQSVDEFRLKLEGYLDHRGAHELVRAASEKLREAEEILASTRNSIVPPAGRDSALDLTRDPAKREGEMRMRMLALISEARFGFREALATWPDMKSAIDGFERAVRVGIDYELWRGAAEAAETLLAELPNAPAELRTRVENALRDKAKRSAHLERLRENYDPNVGRTTRLSAALILGAFLILLPHVFAHFSPTHHADPMKAYRTDLVLLFVTAMLAFFGRESLSKTAINRGFVRISIFLFVAQLAVALGTAFGPLNREALYPMRFFGPLCGIGAAALLIEIRLLPSALAYLIAMFVEAMYPNLSEYVSSGANFITVVCFAVAWIYPRKTPDAIAA